MKFSMTGQENGDLLIQVTTWASLSVSLYIAQITDLSNRMSNVSENINSLCILYAHTKIDLCQI